MADLLNTSSNGSNHQSAANANGGAPHHGQHLHGHHPMVKESDSNDDMMMMEANIASILGDDFNLDDDPPIQPAPVASPHHHHQTAAIHQAPPSHLSQVPISPSQPPSSYITTPTNCNSMKPSIQINTTTMASIPPLSPVVGGGSGTVTTTTTTSKNIPLSPVVGGATSTASRTPIGAPTPPTTMAAVVAATKNVPVTTKTPSNPAAAAIANTAVTTTATPKSPVKRSSLSAAAAVAKSSSEPAPSTSTTSRRTSNKTINNNGKLDINEFSVNQMISGKVKTIESYGLFVDVNCQQTNALLHITRITKLINRTNNSNISTSNHKTLRQMFKPGQQLKARISKVNVPLKRISLTMLSIDEETKLQQIEAKEQQQQQQSANNNTTSASSSSSSSTQAQENVSSTLKETADPSTTRTVKSQKRHIIRTLLRVGYNKDKFIEGTVHNITDFGIFVKVNPVLINRSIVDAISDQDNIVELDGLLHMSSCTIKDPQKKLSIGSKIHVRVKNMSVVTTPTGGSNNNTQSSSYTSENKVSLTMLTKNEEQQRLQALNNNTNDKSESAPQPPSSSLQSGKTPASTSSLTKATEAAPNNNKITTESTSSTELASSTNFVNKSTMIHVVKQLKRLHWDRNKFVTGKVVRIKEFGAFVCLNANDINELIEVPPPALPDVYGTSEYNLEGLIPISLLKRKDQLSSTSSNSSTATKSQQHQHDMFDSVTDVVNVDDIVQVRLKSIVSSFGNNSSSGRGSRYGGSNTTKSKITLSMLTTDEELTRKEQRRNIVNNSSTTASHVTSSSSIERNGRPEITNEKEQQQQQQQQPPQPKLPPVQQKQQPPKQQQPGVVSTSPSTVVRNKRRTKGQVLSQLETLGWDRSQFVQGKIVSETPFGKFVRLNGAQFNDKFPVINYVDKYNDKEEQKTDIGEFDGLLHISSMEAFERSSATSTTTGVLSKTSIGDTLSVRLTNIEEGRKATLSLLTLSEELKQMEHEHKRMVGSDSAGGSRSNAANNDNDMSFELPDFDVDFNFNLNDLDDSNGNTNKKSIAGNATTVGNNRSKAAIIADLEDIGWDVDEFVNGEVIGTTSFGLFVRIDVSQLNDEITGFIDGMCHISSLSLKDVTSKVSAMNKGGNNKIIDIDSMYNIGDVVQVRVKDIDEERIALSMISVHDEMNNEMSLHAVGGGSGGNATGNNMSTSSNNNNGTPNTLPLLRTPSSSERRAVIVEQIENIGWDRNKFVSGVVVNTALYGAFVRVNSTDINSNVNGTFEGLVHITSMASSRNSSNTNNAITPRRVRDICNIGDTIQVRLKNILDDKKVEFSMISESDELKRNSK